MVPLSFSVAVRLRAKNLTRECHIVGADCVHTHLGQPLHLRTVVDGPGNDAAAGGVRDGHEFAINEGPLTPEVSPAHGEQGVQVIYGVADLEHAAWDARRNALRLGDLPMVKGVHCAPQAHRLKGRERACSRPRTLQLRVRNEPQLGVERERVVEARDGGRNWLPGRNGVVVDPQDPIRMQVDVELTALGTQLGRPPEGGEGVLGVLAGGAAVGDDFRAGHGGSLTSVTLRRLTFRECL